MKRSLFPVLLSAIGAAIASQFAQADTAFAASDKAIVHRSLSESFTVYENIVWNVAAGGNLTQIDTYRKPPGGVFTRVVQAFPNDNSGDAYYETKWATNPSTTLGTWSFKFDNFFQTRSNLPSSQVNVVVVS